jgi:glycosyltransferase involved in cell wall biosynthesis/2-polyprenyl-3-methyl-5-hydroxy-6-metoxy-1,4-benzoquinol methylase
MNITIAFDVTWMNVENPAGGVFQYAQRLISALAKHSDLNVVAIIGPIGKGIFDDLKRHNNFREVLLKSAHLFPEILKSEMIDVIHTPIQWFYNCTFSVPMITSLHDLQHCHYPEFFTKKEIQFRNTYYKKSAEFSERVIVSFEHVKKDLVKFFNIPSDKIDVCPLGFDNPIEIDQNRFPEIREKYKLPGKYLFYSANTWRHKNHIVLIRALKLVHEKYGEKVALVCTGQKYEDYFPQIEEHINKHNLREFINFTGYIPEKDMHLLLKNATLAVIPTLYEAGSFPLIEAMLYDVPVICSNVTSLPGTISDTRFIFDPGDTEQMAEKIAFMLKDEKLIEENRGNSRKRVKEGGWDRMVLNFVDSYTKAVKGFRQEKAISVLKIRMQNYELFINKTIEREERRANSLRAERDRLKTERDEILNSLSWKVLAPAKFLLRHLRKGYTTVGSLKNLFRWNYWFVRHCLIKFFSKIRKDDHRILYVNPNDIIFTISKDDPTLKGNSVWHFGSVESGNWDINGYPVQEYGSLYKILKQRVIDKLEYEQIPEFMENLRIIERGGSWYNYKSRNEYFRRWQYIENLYLSIKKNGYKTRIELGEKDLFDEVRIQIGRKGELLFEEGLHRLVIAQLLNLNHIPVVIYRRHKEWAQLRDYVKRIVLNRGFFHQPFNHPDIDILPKWYGNELKDQALYGHERWDFILGSLPIKQGKVLDIGAYFGYFCHRFENIGFECYAIELDKDNYAVLKQYHNITEKKFKILNKNVFDLERVDFDIVLALNVFHHTIKKKQDYEKLIEFLGRLSCKAMYFEPGKSGDDAYRNFNDKEFVDFILSNSSLNHALLLGPTKVGRNLYLLTS